MPWEPDYIEDGEAASAASVNDRFDDAKAWIDELGRTSTRRGAFNHYHAWSPLTELDPAALTLVADDGEHTYDVATFGASLTYTTYGADGGADDVPSIGSGDRTLVGHPSQTGAGTPPECVITFTEPYKVGMAEGDRVGGILLVLNMQVLKFDRNDASPLSVMFCFQYLLDSGATWYTIDVSERILSHGDHVLDSTDADEIVDFDVPIATVLTKEVVDEHGDHNADSVEAVRVMLSLVGPNPSSSVTLERFTFSALPLHAEDP